MQDQPRIVKKTVPIGSVTVPAWISIGILAWNEEEAIGAALDSLFRQTLFAQFAQRELKCEIICVANGCTDATPTIAEQRFQEQAQHHPFKQAFGCRAVNLREGGKNNAWNIFVHELSMKEAHFLFLMDGDILLQSPETLWNMYTALSDNIATDQPLKDILFKQGKTLWEKGSLGASRMTKVAPAQLSGQLYAIRAEVARNIYLPRDLAACEDGFIKALACTTFLTREAATDRITVAPNASHVFQAYTKPRDIFRNQKRQMIGQTIVHLLVDDHLKRLTLEQKLNLGQTIRQKEEADPDWLKRLIAAHLRKARFFWRLFPELLTFRFRRLARLSGKERVIHFPAAAAGFFVAMLASFLAYRFLRQGSIHYWPDTRSARLPTLSVGETGRTKAIINDVI